MIVSCYKQHFKVSVFVMVFMRLILVFIMMNILVIFQFWWSTKIFEMEKTWYISVLPEWYNVKATSSLSVDVPLDVTNISVLKYFKSFVWRLIQYFWPRMPTQSIGAIFQCSMLTLPVWSSCWEGDISTNSKKFQVTRVFAAFARCTQEVHVGLNKVVFQCAFFFCRKSHNALLDV